MYIYIVIPLVLLIVLAASIGFFKLSGHLDQRYTTGATIGTIVTFLIGCIGLIGVLAGGVLYVCNIWGWIASDYHARIINREYGTNYTKEEIFFASSSIEIIRELDRKRYQINGNLITGEPPKDNQEKP